MSEPRDDSLDVLVPYISGQMEFGYHKYGYYPFDYTNGAYPTQDVVGTLDVSSDLSIEWVKI